MFADFRLESFLLPIRYYLRPYLARLSVLAAFEDSHHHCLVFAARSSDLPRSDIGVHVAGFLPDEGFVRFNVAGEFVGRLHTESNADSVIQKPCRFLCDIQGAVQSRRLDTPFLQLLTIQVAVNHLSNPSGESS